MQPPDRWTNAPHRQSRVDLLPLIIRSPWRGVVTRLADVATRVRILDVGQGLSLHNGYGRHSPPPQGRDHRLADACIRTVPATGHLVPVRSPPLLRSISNPWPRRDQRAPASPASKPPPYRRGQPLTRKPSETDRGSKPIAHKAIRGRRLLPSHGLYAVAAFETTLRMETGLVLISLFREGSIPG